VQSFDLALPVFIRVFDSENLQHDPQYDMHATLPL